MKVTLSKTQFNTGIKTKNVKNSNENAVYYAYKGDKLWKLNRVNDRTMTNIYLNNRDYHQFSPWTIKPIQYILSFFVWK